MRVHLFLPLIFVALSLDVYGHGGGLDRYGCHHNRKTGDYHCHRSSGNYSTSYSEYSGQTSTNLDDELIQEYLNQTYRNETPQKHYPVKNSKNWNVFHVYPETEKEYVRAETNELGNNVGLTIDLNPDSDCSPSYYLGVKMSEKFKNEVNTFGKITFKFDDLPVSSENVSYFASEGSEWLWISINKLTEQIINQNKVIIRVDEILADAPTYNFSLLGSSAALAKAQSVCKKTNSYQLR